MFTGSGRSANLARCAEATSILVAQGWIKSGYQSRPFPKLNGVEPHERLGLLLGFFLAGAMQVSPVDGDRSGEQWGSLKGPIQFHLALPLRKVTKCHQLKVPSLREGHPQHGNDQSVSQAREIVEPVNALHELFGRRLQSRRAEPILEMRAGVDPSCFPKEGVALWTGWKLSG
jgi:hypothetical protein